MLLHKKSTKKKFPTRYGNMRPILFLSYIKIKKKSRYAIRIRATATGCAQFRTQPLTGSSARVFSHTLGLHAASKCHCVTTWTVDRACARRIRPTASIQVAYACQASRVSTATLTWRSWAARPRRAETAPRAWITRTAATRATARPSTQVSIASQVS
jgi:hypothetical protein